MIQGAHTKKLLSTLILTNWLKIIKIVQEKKCGYEYVRTSNNNMNNMKFCELIKLNSRNVM